jgi:hypothetical protein
MYKVKNSSLPKDCRIESDIDIIVSNGKVDCISGVDYNTSEVLSLWKLVVVTKNQLFRIMKEARMTEDGNYLWSFPSVILQDECPNSLFWFCDQVHQCVLENRPCSIDHGLLICPRGQTLDEKTTDDRCIPSPPPPPPQHFEDQRRIVDILLYCVP